MTLKETYITKKILKHVTKVRTTPESGDLVELCSSNVVWFAEKMLGMELFAWQVVFLKSLQDSLEGRSSKISVCMTSRQIGKTTAVAVFALWASVFNKKPEDKGFHTNVCLTSRDFASAKKLLSDIRILIRIGDRFMRDRYVDSDDNPLFGYFEDGKYVGFFASLLSKDQPNNATTLTWEDYDKDVHGDFLLKDSKVGSKVICIPPTPTALGNSFSIGIIDEAAHDSVPDSFWFDDLKPTGDATNAMWVMISTPWNPKGFFYEFIDLLDEFGSESQFVRMYFTLNALRDDPSPRAQAQYKRVIHDIETIYKPRGRFDEVKRGYYCEFVKGDSSFFSMEAVNGCFDSSASKVESFEGACDLGVDFGGSGKSHTVVTACALLDGVVTRLNHHRYPVDDDLSLINDIESYWFKNFNVQRVVVDDCPAGRHLINVMVHEKGWNVTRFVFRREKVSKYTAFKDMLYAGRVRSYTDDILRLEMLGLEHSKGMRTDSIRCSLSGTDDLIDSFVIGSYHFLTRSDFRVKSFSFDSWGDD